MRLDTRISACKGLVPRLDFDLTKTVVDFYFTCDIRNADHPYVCIRLK